MLVLNVCQDVEEVIESLADTAKPPKEVLGMVAPQRSDTIVSINLFELFHAHLDFAIH